MDVAPRMTWLFVSTSPEGVSTMPVPAAAPPNASVVFTTTTPVLTVRVLDDVSRGRPSAADAPATSTAMATVAVSAILASRFIGFAPSRSLSHPRSPGQQARLRAV